MTDITRMDQLGIPVFASVRPRGATLRVHAGKGLSPMSARIGALMEALETEIGERKEHAGKVSVHSVAHVSERLGAQVRFVDLIPRFSLSISPDECIETIECEVLGTDRSVAIPAELVLIAFTPASGKELFGWSSNGLASGSSVAAATIHAIFEVLERDALALNMADDDSCWIAPSTLPAPFDSLSAEWAAVGIEVAVRSINHTSNLPCFEAYIRQQDCPHAVDLVEGSALHVDAGVAVTKAICEAAQSRLSLIHGGRDDVIDFFPKGVDTPIDAKIRAELAPGFEGDSLVDFGALSAGYSTKAHLTTLETLLPYLRLRGFGPFYRHVFRTPAEFAVVRVVIPGCEFIEDGARRIGPRLIERLASKKTVRPA